MRPGRGPLRWVLMGLALVLVAPFFVLVAAVGTGEFKTYYLPAEGMAPTLAKGDRFLAALGTPKRVQRGEIIVFPANGVDYVKRVAGLPGDRVALKQGIVFLDGRAVAQSPVRDETSGGGPVRRLSERFPGEAQPHEIYDSGPSAEDDFPEVTVPAGHVFVLGDNRDNSADSRVREEEMGTGFVDMRAIRGRALYRTWPLGRAGTRL